MPCPLQGWRNMESFDNIWKLVGVPVITVQLRYNGWVTEMQVLPPAALSVLLVRSTTCPWCSFSLDLPDSTARSAAALAVTRCQAGHTVAAALHRMSRGQGSQTASAVTTSA